MLLLPCIQSVVQLLVELRCEQVGGHGSTLPAWQSSSVTSTMLLKQPEKVKVEYWNTVNRPEEKNCTTDLILTEVKGPIICKIPFASVLQQQSLPLAC